MFFPKKIKNIKPADKVLEIGPGAFPHPRADIFLEKIFEGDEALAQSGFQAPVTLKQKIVYYGGKEFPFEDKSFDYIICSHVIEHVPVSELPLFISELQRVASKGYIEFPTVFYELINYQPVHIWLMNLRNRKMLFLDKSLFVSNNVHQVVRSAFYGADKYLLDTFSRYKELFFMGFEWSDHLDFEVVSDFNALVNDEDLVLWQNYFCSLPKGTSRKNTTFPDRLLRRIKKLLTNK